MTVRANEVNPIKVDIQELITFYDEDPLGRPHSNAFKTLAGEELGFALLIEYFKRQNRVVDYLGGPCTTGNQKGPRLDGWLKVSSNYGEVVYYQSVYGHDTILARRRLLPRQTWP